MCLYLCKLLAIEKVKDRRLKKLATDKMHDCFSQCFLFLLTHFLAVTSEATLTVRLSKDVLCEFSTNRMLINTTPLVWP